MLSTRLILVASLFALLVTFAVATPTHIKYPSENLDLESLPKHEDGDPIFPREIVLEIPQPSDEYPYALLLTENSCKLRKQFSKVRSFLATDLPYYFQVKTKLTGGLPRIRFFKNKQDWERNTVDSSELSLEEMKQLLQNLRDDPNYNSPKDSTVEVQLSQETTEDDLKDLLKKFGVPRDLTFHKERVPVIFEDDDDRPGNKKFDMEAVIKEVDPNIGNIELTPETLAEVEAMIKKEREEIVARIAREDAEEAAKAAAAKAEANKSEL